MKTSVKVLSFVLFALLSLNIQAQTIKLPSPEFSTDLMSALKPGNDLGFSSDKKGALEKENKSFVNDIVSIAGSSDDDETKKSKILNRKKERDGVLGSVLDDSALKSYKKEINKQIRPLKSKYKLAKLVF
ncbi:hypothetical protein [Formosa haliotis]|uniref:hypothetical protein n=1 Tax=Formosa haliotis TaxID=1555194 RepID=UPI000826064F|nr:hypothetical protein [Formosa haliotis]